jgi:hypothetical protein
MLPLNNQLCNYIKDISPDCNFCKLAGKAHQDGFNHFFFKCPCTREFLAKFVTMLGLSLNLDSNDFHTLYWYGYNDDIKEHQTAFLTVFDSFRYVLYRLRNTVDIFYRYMTQWSVNLYFLFQNFVEQILTLS